MGGANPKGHKSYEVTKNSIRSSMSAIEKNIQAALAQVKFGAKEALDDIAEEISERSLKIAPEDTGELINSHYIAHEETPSSFTVEIGYKADHAVFVHENSNRVDSEGVATDYRDPTTPNTHYRFLLDPANEVEAEISSIVAKSIKKQLKGIK